MTSDPDLPGSRDILVAGAWMVGALLSFSAMAIAVRELHATTGSFQIVFWRSAIGIPILLVIAWRMGLWDCLRTQRFGFHVFRNIIHFGGQFAWVVAIAMLPLAEVFAIEFTVPIWTLILATLFLGEKMTRGRVIAVAAGFMGILVILQPGFAEIELGAWIMLGGALCFGGAIATTKSLTRTEKPITILLLMQFIQLPISAVPAALEWVNPTMTEVPFILITGVSGLTAHYCMTRAFALADASITIPIDFLRLPAIAVIGFLLYSEPLEVAVLVGALIIFAGNYYNLRLEHRAAAARD